MGRSRDLANLGDYSASSFQIDTITDTSGGNTTSINSTTPTAYNTMGKNRIINGSMVVAQRGGGASTTLTNSATTYCVDRWAFYRDVGGTFTAVQSGTAPAGFSSSSLITASTGASPSAAQVNFVQQQIEGFNVDDLKWGTSDAKSVTLSFWVRSSVTGSFPVGISNVDLTRSNRFDVTISSADTWTYVTKTIAGDTTGTWATGNTAGIRLYFDLGSGSDYVGTADTWTGTWDIRTSSSMTWGATTGATLYITGVQLEAGSEATEFEHRQYGTELELCQRYYSEVGKQLVGRCESTTIATMVCSTAVKMRTAPTASTITTSSAIAVPGISSNTITGIAAQSTTNNAVYISFNSSSLTSGTTCMCQVDRVLGLSAEL